jgi:hypothetical protein
VSLLGFYIYGRLLEETSPNRKVVRNIFGQRWRVIRVNEPMTEKPPYPQNYFDTVLAENFVISSEEQEINLEKKVKAERLQQFIRLVLEPPYEDGVDIWAKASEPSIVTPSGEKTNPEIRVIDENGKEYNMIYAGQSGKEIVLYEMGGCQKFCVNECNSAKFILSSNMMAN